MLLLCTAFGFSIAVQLGYKGTSDQPNMLIQDNIEALTSDGEASPCTPTTNGYKEWKAKGGIFDSKREFYDCCSVLREGYKPSGNCNG